MIRRNIYFLEIFTTSPPIYVQVQCTLYELAHQAHFMLESAGENCFGNILNQESDIYTGGQDSYQDQLTLQ